VPTPVCAPSRATILSGKYAHNNGVQNNGVWAGGVWAFRAKDKDNEPRALPVWLRAAGYRTGMFGKYLNGHEGPKVDVPQGWDRWVSYAKVTLSRTDVEVIEDGGAKHDLGKQYDTDYFAEQAVRWVESVPEPFFAMFSPMSPHGPFVPPRRNRGRFDRVDLKWPPSFSADVHEVTKLTRTRLEMMLGVTEALEQLIAALAKRGILERTYVVFTSDHGLFMGEHGHAKGKGEPYEETTRVPLYVRGPGVPVGRSDALVSNADLAPTFAAIAGATVPADVDGQSILPLWHGRMLEQARRRLLLEWFDPGGKVLWQGLRTPDRKFVRYADGRCLSFALASDPYEMTSGACDDAFARESDAYLRRLATCTGADCVAIESE
jgi:arylsulfatase A-like enzyme